MGEIIGGLFGGVAGVALALGALGTTGARHWAVRVLCALAALAVILSGVLLWLFGGRDSLLPVVLDRAALAFLVSVGILSIAWAWRALAWVHAGGSRRALIAAGIVASVAAGAWWLTAGSYGEPERAQAVPVASVSTGETERAPLADGALCPCGTGLVCIGPRGGRYCTRPDGGKSYIGK